MKNFAPYLQRIALNIFVLKGDLNGENRSGAFLFLSGICTSFQSSPNNVFNHIHLHLMTSV